MKPISAPFTFVTDRIRGRGHSSRWIEYLVTICCAIGNMLFGYDQGVMGGFLTSPAFEKQFPSINTSSPDGNATLQGFTVAVYEIGCAFGALSVTAYGDRLGRRQTVLLGQLILVIGTALQASSFSLGQLIVGRIVTGVGNGAAVAVLPLWNGECARAAHRGRLLMWQLNINILGIAVAYWVDYGTQNLDGGWEWRFPLALQVVLAATTVLLCCVLPDSPRALVKMGRLREARDVLDMLSLEADQARRDEETRLMMALVEHALEAEVQAQEQQRQRQRHDMTIAKKKRKGGWLGLQDSDMLTQGRPRFFQRLVLATMALCMLQISGINLITYYATVIFEDVLGMSRNMALLLSGVNGLEYWLATFIPIPLVDRLGRRPLMLFSAVGQCVSMAVLAACISFPGSKAAGYVATVFLFVFNTFFAVGFCGIPWLLPVELTPLKTRGRSVAVANGCFWLCNFLVVMISPVMINNIGYKTYIVWAVTNLCFIPMIYFLIPETQKANLEDMDVLFESNPTWIIGPGSKRQLAAIIANRQEAEAMAGVFVEDETKAAALAVEEKER